MVQERHRPVRASCSKVERRESIRYQRIAKTRKNRELRCPINESRGARPGEDPVAYGLAKSVTTMNHTRDMGLNPLGPTIRTLRTDTSRMLRGLT